MADNADASSDAQVTFKVKTSSDKTHTITMSEAATVLELKTKLAGEDFENIAVERQRLIYSGRVMKNDDSLGSYKIKANNTIHMVKSAASNPGQPASTSTTSPAAPQAPTNMASGTANNPLAGLTGARYAGHQINLPGMDMFGPDGGMGPPMDAERMERMMSDPNMQQTMNEVLNNPDMVNLLIESNPMLRNMPNAREMLTSPFMRSLMTNPQLMRSAFQMQRGMGGGGNSAFPAPGATDQGSEGGATGEGNNAQGGQGNAQQNPFANPFMMPGMMGGGEGGAPNLQHLMQMMAPFGQAQAGQTGAATTGQTGTQQSTTETQGATQGQEQNRSTETQGSTPAANPFAALFPPAGGAQGGQTNPANPFGITPEMMAQMQQMMMGGGGGFGGFGGAPAAPPDNRPPEERYADQLRQLNDMGFYDFDRNVAALRRSGGSVQGAVEYLLSAMN